MISVGKNILFILFMIISVGAQSSERVTIKNMIGRVEIRSTSGKWRPARVNMPIKANWDIRTYVESSVALKFANGTVLKLGENSVVSLGKLFQDNSKQISKTDVKIANGQVWANVKKLVNKNSDFKFETPTAVAAIRGTKLGIDVQKGKTVVDVYKGKVAVRNKGSNKTVLVVTKNRAVVKKGESGISMVSFEEASKGSGTDSLPAVLNPFEVKDSVSDSTSVIDSTSTEINDSLNSTDTTVSDSSSGTQSDTLTAADSATSETVELELKITSPGEDIQTESSLLNIMGSATPGAVVSCLGVNSVVSNSGKFKLAVVLVPGENPLNVSAKLGDQQKSISLRAFFDAPKELFLEIKSPVDKSKIKVPNISVMGSATQGALIYVNGNSIPVSNGQFSYKLPIPDEEGEYSVEVVAEYKGKEKTVVHSVIYEPEREKNFLTLLTPKNGEKIETDKLTVSGRTLQTSSITVNGKGTPVGADGSFVNRIPVSERDIGDFTVEVTSEDHSGGVDVNKSIDVSIDGKSKLINRSIPTVSIVGVVGNSTKNSSITFAVSDLTPDDRLTVTSENNGSKDIIDADPGNKFSISLDEGKNSYRVWATDIAGNSSATVSGNVYYLPGPIDIDIIEPDDKMLNIDDLPPMPKNTGALKLPIKVELDDGIGDVPETILYCKVNGSNLKESSKYIYSGTLEVHRGSNTLQFTVEDISGNRYSKGITVNINQ